MKGRVAIIRDDHTWWERVVETDGANANNARTNAEWAVRMELCPDGKYPPNVIGIHCYEVGELPPWSPSLEDTRPEILVASATAPDRVAAVIATVKQIIKIFNGEAEWKTKYDVIFGIYSGVLSPQLEAAGLDLDWYDPDGSYQDDVTAFVNAAERLMVELEKTT